MPTDPKFPKMSEAAKKRAAAQPRASGKFAVAETIDTAPSVGAERRAVLPPQADVDYQSIFIAPPAPVNGILYNPDEAFLQNPENASRMIQDMAIYSALQERQLATAALPWSIVPQDEEDAAQMEAADCIENIIRSHMPNLADCHRNMLDAIWFGRSGMYIDYRWDYSEGMRRMVPKGWTPVHGDTLVFSDDGRIGYKVGVPNAAQAKDMQTSVMGQYIPVDEDAFRAGEQYLQAAQRKAWVVHHYQKTAGEYRLFATAASKFGLGLRSRIYPIWVMKQSTLQFYMNAAEKFGSGWVIGYFDAGNPRSAAAVKSALEKQVGSCVQMFPRYAPEADAVEGMELVDPPSGGYDGLRSIIDYFDKQIRMTICSESLTSDNADGGGGLGSNLAEVQQTTFGRLVKYDSASLGETYTDQLVSVLQEFNGYGHLPPLRFQFSYDIGTTKEKIETAKMLFDMGARFDMTQLMLDAGLEPLEVQPIATEVTEGGEVIDTTGRVPGAEESGAVDDETNEDDND